MSHERVWRRLPDLLEDRDDPELLAHLRSCHACQRQLFLLGRVDRLLRDTAPARRRERRRARRGRWLRFPGRLGAVAAVALLALALPHGHHSRPFTLRTASGQAIGRAILAPSDGRSASLSLVAQGLPARGKDVYLLWAGGEDRTIAVGRFMVDPSGACRARFTLPGGGRWERFWVTPPGQPDAVVATT